MNITSYSRDQIQDGINKARERNGGTNEQIRLLFTPEKITEENFERTCEIYSRVDMSNYETVVVIESHEDELNKKLSMASNHVFETPLGQVPANDYMRNEFCDEDDDFFIHDEAFDKNASLFQQLMFLQTLSDDFSVVNIQIGDNDQSIVKELAFVLEEVLASRNALLIFCCELDNEYKKEFESIKGLVETNNQSGLLNYLNGDSVTISGVTSFIAGVLVANQWGLELNFLNDGNESYDGNLLSAYARQESVLW